MNNATIFIISEVRLHTDRRSCPITKASGITHSSNDGVDEDEEPRHDYFFDSDLDNKVERSYICATYSNKEPDITEYHNERLELLSLRQH